MDGFEEVSSMEGMYAPINVRRELKQMFSRWLTIPIYSRAVLGEGEVINEVDLLDLCEHFRLEYPGEDKDLAKNWNNSEYRKADGGPIFEDLVSMGWVLFDGGRWLMQQPPTTAISQITYPSNSTKNFLEGLSKPRLVPKTNLQPTAVLTLVERINDQSLLEKHVPIGNPEWFMGRLWEQICPTDLINRQNHLPSIQMYAPEEDDNAPLLSLTEANIDALDSAFLEWTAWCHIFGVYGIWDSGWSPSHQRLCREAAHRVLKRQTLWGEWDRDLARYVKVMREMYTISDSHLRFAYIAEKMPPYTLIERADWLASREVEYLMLDRFMMQSYGPNMVSIAFALLCSELEKIDIGQGIMDAADALLSFAIKHPMALLQLKLRVDTEPKLLVDMLLFPPAVCLAAKWTVEWRQHSERNTDLSRYREAQTKTFAVQDSLSLIAYHLDTNSISLEECASLIMWCYKDSMRFERAIADPRRVIGRQLLRMFAKQNEQVQSEVLKHLVDHAAYENNVPRVCFSGVLDAVNSLPLVSDAAITPVIALYSSFARKQNLDWTDAAELSSKMASRLVAAACAQVATERDAFLIPFDSMELIHGASSDNQFTVRSSVARTMRTHIRLIARAVSDWPYEYVPPVLCEALKILISKSIIEHDEKGRIGALTDRYSPNHFRIQEEGSPAQDLASAWRQLDESNQEDLLQVFAQSDDPVLLAELCQYLPATAKTGIKARLLQLKPSEASNYWTWTEIHHRIETLLIAGEYDLAREHLESIRPDLNNAPQQFWLALFVLELRLFLKEENWTALDNATFPPTLVQTIARQADEQLEFYRATSQLLRPNGDLVSARNALRRLSSKPGASTTYRDNYFAVAIQNIIGPTLHPLIGEDKIAGEHLLEEINSVADANNKLASDILIANRAILLLALQKPAAALESVAQRRSEVRNSELEMVVVRAKYEMGHEAEAMAILDAAINEFEKDNKRLVEFKKELQEDRLASRVASASVSVDSVSSIRTALQQLAQLPIAQVGDVLGPPGLGFSGYLVREVSKAVASLQRMVGMLRPRGNALDEAKFEDDLNSAVREVLGASLAIAKWDVADQSLGGITAKGNPGERDAVIRVSGQEISIYEALVCKGVDRTNIKYHFDKLLSYGTCFIYFHVIYSYAEEIKPILDYVRSMLEHETLPQLSYCGCEELTPPSFETSGYLATYRVDHRDVVIAFLVADLKIRTV